MTGAERPGLEQRDLDERTILLVVGGDAVALDGLSLAAGEAVVLTASRDEALERLDSG